ncbi:thioesterase II family protein [Streptomyces sp. NRRL S-31]|uniref:thioesterase II family protein n=1 Tax=Streptomyces sp. NRRL S-31 TaxID=1463898 RepID=UPI0004CC1D2D|nr:alpha/beta fold hydrolase [Streptomyces sp. NRRL S-31]
MPPEDRRTTLVCLPFAGAGASFFRPWSQLNDALDVLPLQLPGRERLIDAAPYREVGEATEGLFRDLVTQLGERRRIALFGHSLGAVLAYELAHRVRAAPELELVRLFVSGSPEPGTPRPRRATGLPDDAFLARVSEFAGYSHEALDDPEMRELILPTLRADVALHESYTPSTDLPLDAPVTSVRGTHDTLVGSDDAAGWAKVAGREFEYVEIPGGHMYLTERAPALLRLIVGSL